jgi:hypothetical protein
MESGQARGADHAGGRSPRDAEEGFRHGGPDDESFAYGPPPRGRGPDFSALFVLLDAVRRAVPREVQHQFTALIREALLALRSLIDWYLDRLDRPPREPEVEEIRID